MKMRPRLKNMLKIGFLAAAGTFLLLSPKKTLSQQSKPLDPPSAVSNAPSISEPLQISNKKKITLDSVLEARLKNAFLDEICKIRADSGYASMPVQNQKLSQAAQEYADTLQPRPPSMLSHDYLSDIFSQGERFYPLYMDKSLNLKNFSIRECIHMHTAVLSPESSHSLSPAQENSLESEVRKAARDLLTSPRHRRILLCNCAPSFLAGAGICISSPKEDGTGLSQILIVYIKAEANEGLGKLQSKEKK